MKVCHIFSGGELKNLDFIKIDAADMIICADRGLNYVQKLGITPNVIVGDFDSFTGTLPDNVEILRSPPEKDDTDTMLAIKTAIVNGAEHIRIYGALGGRFDHAYANVQALKYIFMKGCTAVLEDSENMITLQNCGECRYPARKDWYFSVFSFGETLEIESLSGVKYTLGKAKLENSFPLGVSNEFTENEAVLTISAGTALVVYSKM